MFKPLLRTLPTLSGNFTIACKLKEYTQESSNDYSTYIRLANLIPLQNYMTNRNIEINLLNGKYEHDIKKYHYYYSNVFYKENFNYAKNNYATLDLQSIYNYNNDARNKDYEFGCKRLQYSQNNMQFNFYAPFYLDDINDLPEYFQISIVINDHLIKNIKIYLNKDSRNNYFKTYLKNYFRNVDDRVIFCLPDSLQATYFGIDVKNGGTVQYKDNLFGILYKSQTTINNFDYTICKGFERNNLIMKQIIPISFSFNINDIFNSYEKEYFIGAKFKVYGHYYSKGKMKYDMYDFDINYTHSYNKYKKFNEITGLYEYLNGEKDGNNINVLDVNYPSLNECKYTKYVYTNKITPIYCKFKLLFSDDNDPYITNASYGYTYNQYPNERYGYFPTMFKGLFTKAIIENKDFKLPIGKTLSSNYKIKNYNGNKIVIDATNANKYAKLMQNYHSYWFNTIIYDDYNDNAIFNNSSLWSPVKYDYSYFKGILYNLSKLKKYNIDKFGVFCNVTVNKFNESDLQSKLIRSNLTLKSEINKKGIKQFNYNQSYDMQLIDQETGKNYYGKLVDASLNNISESSIESDVNMIKDINGNFIKENNYNEEMCYYKLIDVIKLFNSDTGILSNNNYEILNRFNDIVINGYELIDSLNNINYFEDYKYNEETKEYLKRFIFATKVYNTNQILSRYYWLKDSLYYSNQTSSTKKLVSEIWDKLDPNEDLRGKFCLFIKNKFVNKSDVIEIVRNYNDNIDKFGDLKQLVELTSNKIINILNSVKNGETPYTDINYDNIITILNIIYKISSQDKVSSNFIEQFFNLLDKLNNLDDNSKISLLNKYDLYDDLYKSYIVTTYSNLNKISIHEICETIISNLNNAYMQLFIDISNVTYECYVRDMKQDEYIWNELSHHYLYYIHTSKIKESIIRLLLQGMYSYDKNFVVENFNIIGNSILEPVLNSLSNLTSYKYELYNKINNIEIKNYFSKNTNNTLPIYIDSYNINKIIDEYNDINAKTAVQVNYPTKYYKFYTKLLNLDHIVELVENMTKYKLNVFEDIYVKQRCFNISDNKLILEDKYTPLYKYLKYALWKYGNMHKDFINILDEDEDEVKNKKAKIQNEIRQLVALYSLNNKTLILEWLKSKLSEQRYSNNNFLLKFDSSIQFELDLCYKATVIKLDENNYLKDVMNKYFLYTFIPDKCINDNLSQFEIKNDERNQIYLNNEDTHIYEDMENSSVYENIDKYLVPLFTNIYFNENDKLTIQNLINTNKINNYYQYVINYNNYFKEIDIDNTMLSILSADPAYNDLGHKWVNEIKNLHTDEIQYNKDGSITYDIYKNIVYKKLFDDDSYNKFINDWNEYCYQNEIYSDTVFTIRQIIEYLKLYDEINGTNIYRYLLYNKGVTLYSINSSFNISYDTLKNNKDLIYDEDSKLYIKNYDGINYGFYLIDLNIDNTNNSFNIDNDYNLNIIFSSIDNHEISNSRTFNIYLKNIFYIIEPFLKIELFTEFVKNINTIYFPYSTEINIEYINSLLNNESEKMKYKILIDSLSDNLYDKFVKLSKSRKINLIRYYNYITPYIKKTNIIEDNWELKFIDNSNVYRNTKKYNVLTKEDINIYKYNGIKYYDGKYLESIHEYDKDPKTIYQIEYKHFNDNLIYNLPENISIEDNHQYTYDELLKYKENKDKINAEKKNILLKYFYRLGLDYNNIILFLFNKYDSNMSFEPIKLRSTKNEKLYKITYKFNLI